MDPAGTTFGSDTSHHQGDVDFAALYRDGLRFAIHKAGQGNWADDKFAANSARSHAAGMITAAYWFLDSRYSVEQHLDAVDRTVPRTMALIPDVERIEGSNGQVVSAPTLAMTRQFVDGARARGYRVPLVYLPRWYWQSWGSPSLAGLPPLWSSRYPDLDPGGYLDEYRDVPASYWDGYGGLPVLLLQFTSSASAPSLSPYDANAFRGTPQQLASLFGVADRAPLVVLEDAR
ncbi:glycoside hydrolase family 25 protein [Amycolatopsis sacchari]|uniref:glycoside hydrolase family 25 protein n=1 Tax=Amycolatopsis sacchari TaxID=115433 RepID=UPI003D764331